MSLKINGFDISQVRINNSNISLAKINGSIVFQLDNNIIITLTFTDKTIKAISNKTGTYDFYYANDNQIINDYDMIVSFNLSANVENSYTYLNTFNIAPYDATKIVVCKGGTTKILGSSYLPSQFLFNSSSYGNKLYSFGALSDVHIDGDGTDEASASSDFARALNFFNSNSSLVGISGDICCEGGYSELSLFKDLVDANATIPVYASRGNHDCRYSISDFETYTGGSLYFEQSHQNDKFIFLGMNAENYGDSCFTTEELDWLETKLESYKNQRVFLFFHVFMPNTCGNINNLYPYSSLDTSSTIIQRFISLMTAYKNVIYFSGHSHLEFACQKFGSNANIFSNGTTCHRVHIPSCAKPRKNISGTNSDDTYTYNEGSEGYLVDVYENCIVLRGRDFIKGKFLPIANYLLDTTIKMVLIKTFYGDSIQEAEPTPDYPQEIQTIVGASLKLTNGTDELLIPIDLKGYDLAKVGDIADELQVDVSTGDVNLVKKTMKIALSTDLQFKTKGDLIDTNGYYTENFSTVIKANSIIMSNFFTYSSTTWDGIGTAGVNAIGYLWMTLLENKNIYTFKEWLDANNVIFIAEAKTPETIALDNIKTQIDAFGTYSSMELEVTYGTEPIIEEVITNLFSAANIITVDDGSTHTSPYVSAGITYTFTEGSPRIITDGTTESNTVQGFKQTSILQAGITYKIWVDNKQGECDLAGKSFSFKLMVSDDYVRTTEYATCYVDPADESSNPSSATFTPTSDITEWYLMIQQRSAYVTLSDYSFDIHVEKVKQVK